MALTTIMSLLDNTVVVQLDVNTSGNVTAASASNNSGRPVTFSVDRPNGNNITSRTLAAGANVSVNIPKGRQFPYSDDVLSDWSVSATVG